MIKSIEYERLNDLDKSYVLIDVRSPKEYENASIPEAINVPIFNDNQRDVIGTTYVQESIEKAKKIGVEAASQNLPSIYEKVSEIYKEYDSLIFFCARGGMRSSSLVSLFMSIGINAFKLKGGYKGYRAYINENLPIVSNGITLIVIHGNTGVGKTNILKELEGMGYDILDLEKCANHRGSLLGGIGLGSGNSQKQFESYVYETFKNRNSNFVFVEGESKRIGNIIIPGFIYNLMEKGIHINVFADIDTRVKNIMDDYINDDNDKNCEIIEALEKLRNYISSKNIDRYIEEVKNRDYKGVIEDLMVKYYDPMYENKKYDYKLEVKNNNVQDTCSKILEALQY